MFHSRRAITRSHENKATSLKGRCIWESFIWVTATVILDSHSARREPVRRPRSSAPSLDRAGQTHRPLVRRAVESSDKFSYWPAETCSYLLKEPHPCSFITIIIIIIVVFLFCFFTLWENKHLNGLWPSRAVLIDSWTPFNKDVVMPAREQWHIWQRLQHPCPVPLLHHKKQRKTNIQALNPSHQEYQIGSNLKKKRTSLIIPNGCKIAALIN